MSKNKINFIDFEQAIAVLDNQIAEMEALQRDDESLDLSEEIEQLRQKSLSKLTELYAELTPWQTAKVARHNQRPYTLDYIHFMFTDFIELHGDRQFADDSAIIGGLARFDGQPCLVIGHQKGRNTKEKIARNFGMPRPEGYRKAQRLFAMAERFQLPVITLIDTPGAYPGIDAEERGQSEAIGRSILDMTQLKVPIIACVIGEGGSGGALAIAVADRILMLQFSVYSVISPEGCASILWKDAEKSDKAAESMAITAEKLLDLDLISEIVPEPLGGAHRDWQGMAKTLKDAIKTNWDDLKAYDGATLVGQRYDKLMRMSRFAGGDIH